MAQRGDRTPADLRVRVLPWRSIASSFVLTVTALALVVGAASITYVRYFEDRIVPGVTVAGVDVGGLDHQAAEVRLRERLPAMDAGTLTFEVDGAQTEVPYADIGRDYDMEAMLDDAMLAGRTAAAPLRAALEHARVLRDGTNVEPLVTVDAAALAERAAAIAEAAHAEAVDATLSRRTGSYEVVPAIPGRTADAAEAASRAVGELTAPSAADVHIRLATRPIAPAVATDVAAEAVRLYESVVRAPLRLEAHGAAATVSGAELRSWIRLEEVDGADWSIVVDEAAVQRFAAHFAQEVAADPRDARLVFEGDELGVIPAVVGVQIDVGSTTQALLEALDGRAEPVGAGFGTATDVALPGAAVEATADITQPELTTDWAEDLAERMEQLSRWRTRYPRGILNYNGANIDIPTEVIHETLLLPGERFDFWEVVGFPTREDGYGPGGAIVNGEMVFDGVLAGGICAVSTTIFNAALRAGLETGARRSHHFHLARYPLGLDATVWLNRNGQGTTVRFTNDMDEPIIIRGIGRRNAVIFEIWGVPDGREVTIARPRIEDRGATYDVWRTRTVTSAEGEVIHNDTYHSRYAWPTDE
jgi:vancomycin resistance protein YoaR